MSDETQNRVRQGLAVVRVVRNAWCFESVMEEEKVRRRDAMSETSRGERSAQRAERAEMGRKRAADRR